MDVIILAGSLLGLGYFLNKNEKQNRYSNVFCRSEQVNHSVYSVPGPSGHRKAQALSRHGRGKSEGCRSGALRRGEGLAPIRGFFTPYFWLLPNAFSFQP